MAGRIFRISLGGLDWADETFRSSVGRDAHSLRESIETVGLLCALRVQRRGDRFRLVSGFLRAEALRAAGTEAVEAEEVGEGGLEDALLLETLHENRFTRGFTWAERAQVLDRVVRTWRRPRSWILGSVMPAMGMPPSPRMLEYHLAVASLSEPVRDAWLRHGCSLGNGLRIAHWPPPDQEAIIPFLEGLRFGESLLREFLQLVREIALREGCPISALLSSPAVREILEDPGMDRPQRRQALRAHLRRRRYPGLISMEQAFRQARGAFRLPPNLSVQPEPFFEESGVRVSFRARTQEEFKVVSRTLWEACQREEALGALFAATEELPT
jgi:hypothetical protein